jgi:ribosomal protein S18 acetylase RimI-like enzyme
LNYTIKQIASKETYTVRHSVLREGKPMDSCTFEGDDFESTYHLGVFIDNKLVGVCTLLKNKHKLILENNQYQLRGMAVLKAYQGKSLGKKLLLYGEYLLKKEHINVIWCHARESAVNFYKKYNYQITGNPFMVASIGLHHIMFKTLI